MGDRTALVRNPDWKLSRSSCQSSPIATNAGLNTKYHVSLDHPAVLYFGDLDGSGNSRLVEATLEDGHYYPVRGKSCSTGAMPSLADRFPTKADLVAYLESLPDDEDLP